MKTRRGSRARARTGAIAIALALAALLACGTALYPRPAVWAADAADPTATEKAPGESDEAGDPQTADDPVSEGELGGENGSAAPDDAVDDQQGDSPSADDTPNATEEDDPANQDGPTGDPPGAAGESEGPGDSRDPDDSQDPDANGTDGATDETDGPNGSADPAGDESDTTDPAADDPDTADPDDGNANSVGAPEATYELVYHGPESGFSPDGADLFAHFGTLVPGEKRAGVVTIANESDATCDFYLHTNQNIASSRADAEDALSLIELAIASAASGETLYEGDLRAAELAGGIFLGTVDPGERIELDFAVSVPAELGNEFALSQHTVPWVFAAQEAPPVFEPEAAPPADDETPTLLAKTGSLSTIALVGVLAAIVVVCALAAFAAKAHTYLDGPHNATTAAQRRGRATARQKRSR